MELLKLCEKTAKEYNMSLTSVHFLFGRIIAVYISAHDGHSFSVEFDDRMTDRTFIIKGDDNGEIKNVPYDLTKPIWKLAEEILNSDDLWFIEGAA